MDVRLLIAVVYWVVFTAGFIAIWPVKGRTLFVHTLLFVILCVIATMNAEFDFIEEKVASFISYDMYEGAPTAITFLLQYYISYPAFALTDSPYAAHSVNLALQSLSFLIAMKFILKERKGTLAGIGLFLFPAYYNFTIFGLRDPYVNLITTIFVASLINHTSLGLFVASAILAFLSLMARPEFSFMLVAFGLLKLFLASSRVVKIATLIVYTAMLYASLLFLPLAFGISSTGSVSGNLQKMAEFNDLRNERRLGGDGAGSGSHILGGKLYNLPMVVRYPIQVAATFVAPLPHEIHGGALAIAFLESLIFTYFAVAAWNRSRGSPKARFLFLCGLLYILAIALFSINYGNILRMRYPGHIMFVGAIALAAEERRRSRRAARVAAGSAPGFAVEQPA